MKSITTKSMTLLSSVSLIVMVLVFGTSYWQATSYFEAQEEAHMLESSEALSVVVQEPIFAYDKALIGNILKAFVDYPYIHEIKAFDHRGKPLAAEIEEASAPSSNKLYTQEIPIKWDGDQVIGKLEVNFRLDSYDTLRNAAKVVCFLVAVTVLGAMLLTNFFTLRRFVVRPIMTVAAALEEIAAGGGDLTKRLDVVYDDELGILATNFNRFIGQLHDFVEKIVDNANKLNIVSDNVRDAAQGNLQAIQRQLVETEQASTALTEMSSTTNEVAQNANTTAEHTKSCSELANEGEQVVVQTASKINELGDEMGATSERITQLREQSETIGSVLDVIKGIAEQTNLLALNAAIEAARAGEQGRGFAVVADEVRNLAGRTQESTVEIEQIIEELQGASSLANQSMESSQHALAMTVEGANQASEKLSDIRNNINEINDMNMQIATASDEQNAVAADISKNVNQIFEVTNEIENNATNAQNNAIQLHDLSDEIKALLSNFKV